MCAKVKGTTLTNPVECQRLWKFIGTALPPARFCRCTLPRAVLSLSQTEKAGGTVFVEAVLLMYWLSCPMKEGGVLYHGSRRVTSVVSTAVCAPSCSLQA